MVIGPLIGTAPDDSPAPALAVPIVYRGDTVAALWFGGTTSRRASRSSSSALPALLAPVLPRRLGHRRRGMGALTR